MNVWQALFCNQYDELIKTGRDGAKARKNGLILSAVLLTLNIFTLYILLFMADKNIAGWLKHLADNIGGKATGRLLGAILFIVIYFVLKYTIGTEQNFKNIVERYNVLAEQDQKQINRRAMIYCFGSIIIFIVAIFLP